MTPSRAAPPPRVRPRWVLPPPVPGDTVAALAGALGLPELVCELLVRRGHADPDAARAFLRPSLEALHAPGRLLDLERAADRVEAALEESETILVHGDYDADGLTAAALLTRGLAELGGRVEPFVPHRLRDGYDLGEAGLARAEAVGAGLILTADCGVSAADAVAAAAAAGRDVVVTDHHRPPPRLPEAVAVVNPAREGSEYPFHGLSGVGVAFKLLSELASRAGLPAEAMNRHLDLVAIGTVADLVPLAGENRTLVRAGLGALARTGKPGIRALAEGAGVDLRSVRASDIGFRLGPRLNAAGRVGAASEGLRLLLTDDEREAGRLAETLERRNRDRRTEDRKVLSEAEERLAERFDPDRDHSAVLWGEGWHPGVIGVAASRIVERIHRPVVLVSVQGESGRGSGRSIPGFHLHRALASCADLLERFGGHAMAAGLEIRREDLPELAERLEREAAAALEPGDLVPELRLDLSLPLGRADRDLHRWFEHFAPFGTGNRRPVLHASEVHLERASTVGSDGDHLKGVLVGAGGARLEAIGFGMGHRLPEVGGDRALEAAYELTLDRYRGRERLQARLRDVRPLEAGRAGREEPGPRRGPGRAS